MDDDYSFETRARKKNIFDDDVSEDAARNIIVSSNDGLFDSEDCEVIDFVDDAKSLTIDSGHFGSEKVKFQKPPIPDLSALATPASRFRQTTEDRTMSNSASFGGASRAVGFGHIRSQSLTFGATSLNKGLSKPEPSHESLVSNSSRSMFDSNEDVQSKQLPEIQEGVGQLTFERKQPSGPEIDKMYQEIQSLKRSLLSARKDRWIKLPLEDTIRRVLKGEEVTLEMYKSLSDKLKLLDLAIKSHDGNAITMAVLFLHRTVTRSIFNRELVQRPVAANHYLMYLKAHFDHSEYINTLIMLGRTEEAAIFKYQLALPTTDVAIKITKVKDSLRGHFHADPALSTDASLVQEHIDLLERQRPIDESDSNLEASGRSALFKDFPRKRALVDMSVVTTLYYCCLYHYDLGENSLASPAALKKRHQVSDKQFTWTALGARAKLKQWADIEKILTTKGWFGSTKMKAAIGFDKVVGILHRNGAPQDILQKYLALVEVLDVRLNLAKKFNCPLAVIDALVALKHKQELERYASKLDRYSKEGLHAFDCLNSPNIKWR